MDYYEQINKALSLIVEHLNYLDKAGEEATYLHSLRVGMSYNVPQLMITGLLHDCIEDTELTAGELLTMGFSPEIVGAVQTLTHKDHVPYRDYIQSVCISWIAVRIKIADIMDNLARLRRNKDKLPIEDVERMRTKWEGALRILQEHLLAEN